MALTRKDLALRLALLAAVIIAVYANTLNHGFVWDDCAIIQENPLVRSLSNIPRFFFLEDIAEGSTGYYRPMTYISFTIDHVLWRGNPIGFNVTNLLLHVAVALLFCRVVAALFKREDLALAAAFIFALHPITAETVNFHAGGRNTLLAACFALLSFLFYMNRKLVPSVIFFTLAIFSKEFALLLPAIFFLYDATEKEEKIRWGRYVPLVVATIGYLALRSSVVEKNANLITAAQISENFWIVPQTIISYLKLMLLPFSVQTMYDVNNQITWTSFITYTVLVLALVALAVVFRKRREVVFAVAMFLLFLAPVTNIFPLGTAMMADRYAYFSLFGFSIGAAYCILLARKEIALVVVTLVAVAFAFINVQRNGYWKDEVSLFTRMIKDAPQMSVGYQNLGYAYYARNDLDQARVYLAQAHSKKDLNSNILISNALTLLELERPDLALSALNRAIEIDPNDPQPYVMAGRINEELHNAPVAKWYRDKASALVPGIWEALAARAESACRKGEDQMNQGNLYKAVRLFYGSLGYNPYYVPALVDMGKISAQRGNLYKAVHYFTTAARLDPLNPYPQYNLAQALQAQGNEEQAQQAMIRFRELDARQRRQSPDATQGKP